MKNYLQKMTLWSIKMKVSLALLLFVVHFGTSQTPFFEMAAGAGNPTGVGPTIANQVINLQNNSNNPTGNTFVGYTPTKSVTYSLQNFQYSTSVLNNSPVLFGGNNTSNNTNNANPLFPLLSTVSTPSSSNFTSSDIAGTGLDINANRGVSIYTSLRPLKNSNASLPTVNNPVRYRYADLVLTFNEPVTDPIIHLTGSGAHIGNLPPTNLVMGFTTELQMMNAGLTFTRLSGSQEFTIFNGNEIRNGASIPSAVTGNGAMSGSVRVNGTNITSLTFRIFVKAVKPNNSNTPYWATGSNDLIGDLLFISTSSKINSDLAVTKTVNNPTAVVGSNVIFTVNATNNGPENSINTNVQDLLPSGYTYVSHTTTGGTYNQTSGLWSIGTLNQGQTRTLTITATVRPTGSYTNTATISGSFFDPVTSNNTASATVTPTLQSDMAVTKTVNNAMPNVGSNVTFTVVATNNGPNNNTSVTVNDQLPSGYSYVSHTVSSGGGTYTPATGVWNIGALNSSVSRTLTIVATVNSTGNYTNTATVTGANTDPINTNNSASASVTPNNTSDMAVTIGINNNSPTVGSTVTFTVNVTNNGPVNNTGVNVNNLLPSGYTYSSHTSSIGTYTPGSGLWDIGSMNTGATQTLTVTATVNPTGDYTNTATVSGNNIDPNLLNNTSSVTPTCVNPTSPIVSTITQPNCTTITGSVVLNNLPTGNWTITRNPGGNTYTGNSTSTTITGLPAGSSYTFTVTNALNCTSGSSTSVVINNVPSTPILGGASSVCVGSTANVTPNTDGTWSSSDNGIATINNSGVVSGVSAGSVTLTYTRTSDGCTNTINISVLERPSAPNIVSITQPTCNNPNGVVELSGLPAGNWTLTRMPGSVTTSGSTSSISVGGLLPGTTYTFTVSNNSGCSSTNSNNVVINNVSPVNISFGSIINPTACGAGNGSFVVQGLSFGTPYVLTYLRNGTPQTPINFTALGTSYTLNGLSSGAYSNIVISTQDGSCTSNALSVNLNDPTGASISLGGTNNPLFCGGTDGFITISGLAPGTNYTIQYTKNGFNQTPINFTAAGVSYTINGLSRGSYTNIRVVNSGCVSNSISATLSDPGSPVVSINSFVNPSICAASDGSFTIAGLTPGGIYTLRYRKNGINQAPFSFVSTGTSYTLSGLNAGAYTNISIGQDSCLSNILALNLNDPGPSFLSIANVTHPSLCSSNDGNITLAGLTNGVQYTLNFVRNGIQQAPTTFTATGTTYVVAGLTAGVYTGINLSQADCKSNTVNATLNNPQGLLIDVEEFDALTCSPGNEGKLIITGLSQGVTYTLTYRRNGVAQAPITISNSPTASYEITGLLSGNYTEIKVNQGGCESNEVSAFITGPFLNAPTLSPSTLEITCPETTADLTLINPTNNFGYQLTWHTSTPATFANQVPDPSNVVAGTYFASYYNNITNCYGSTTLYEVTYFCPKVIAQDDINQTQINVPVSGGLMINDINAVQLTAANQGGINIPFNISTAINGGTIIIQNNGNYTFTPAAGFTGSVPPISYTARNIINSDTDSANLFINVIEPFAPTQNNDPIANHDTATAEQGQTISVNPLSNDSDLDGDDLTVLDIVFEGSPISTTASSPTPIVIGGNPAGTAYLDNNGNLIFEADPAFDGEVTFNYIISDGNGGEGNSSITITVLEPSDEPMVYANDDANAAPKGDQMTGNVLTNDQIEGTNPLVTTASANFGGTNYIIIPGNTINIPSVGEITLLPNGDYTFNPDPNFENTLPIRYTVCNNEGNCDTATLYLTSVTLAKVLAQDDINQTQEGISINGSLLTNDDNATQITVVTQGALNIPLGVITTINGGTILVNADGTYTFNPANGFEGNVPVIDYTASNADNSSSDIANLYIEVIKDYIPGQNNPPIANHDTATVAQNATVTVLPLINDSDLDGDTLTITGITYNSTQLSTNPVAPNLIFVAGQPAGSVYRNGNTLVFTANSTYKGDVPFTYTITDGNGGNAISTINITVIEPSSEPQVYANDDANSAPQAEVMTGNILSNDQLQGTNPEVKIATALHEGLSYPVLVGSTTTIPGLGDILILPNGDYTFTPDPTYEGTLPITYTVCNEENNCSKATLYLTSMGVPQVEAQDDINQTQEGVAVSGNILTNDDNATQVTVATQGALNIVIGTPTTVIGGEITINTDGSYTFVPSPGFSGSVPVVNYTAANADATSTDTANLYIEVIKLFVPGENNDPVANHDTATVEQGETVTVNPLLNDSDLDGDTIIVNSITFNGTPISTNAGTPTLIVIDGSPAGTAYQDPTGNLVFVSDPNFEGDVPFEYTITDGNGGSANSSINVTVVEPSATPEVYANDDANAAPQGEDMTGNVLDNDQLDGTNPEVTSAVASFDGTDYPITPGTPVSIPGVGTIEVHPNGDYTFTPEPTFEGTLPLTYTVCNDEGNCDTATLYLTSVAPLGVEAQDDINQTQEGVAVSGNILTNDDNATQVTVATQGALNIVIGTPTTVIGGEITINTDGSYTFVPSPGFSGSVQVVNYTAANADATSTDTANLYIEVIKLFVPGENNDPVANHDTATVEQGETVTVNPLLNDSDLDGDTIIVNSITFNGTPISTNSGTPTLIVIDGSPAGTAYQDPTGNLVFVSDPNFEGNVPFEYTITDGNGGSANSSISVTVVEPSATPEVYANDDANAAPQGEDMTGNVLDNDQLDGTNPEVTSAIASYDGTDYPITPGTPVSIPGVGTIEVQPNGDYTFTPEPTFEGTLPLAYTVCNDEGNCDTATLYLTSVAPLGVEAQDDINQTQEGVAVSGNILTNDNNATLVGQVSQGGVVIPFGIVTPIIGGSILINSDGSYTYTPTPRFSGSVPAIDYLASNADGSSTDNASLYIEVIKFYDPSRNNPPIANHDTATVEQGETIAVKPLLNDSDLDGDTLSVENITYLGVNISTDSSSPTSISVGGIQAGSAYLDSSNNLVFVADTSFEGDVLFGYSISDGNSGTANSTINITVVEPTGRPEVYANDDANAAPQGEDLTGNVLDNDQLDGTNPEVTAAVVSFDGTDYPIIPGTPLSIPGVGTIDVQPNGEYTFNPDPNFEGTLPVEYTVCNAEGNCDNATLFLTSIAPLEVITKDDINQTQEGIAVRGNLFTNDENVSQVTAASQGATNIPLGVPTTINGGVITIETNGTYLYSPASGFTGSVPMINYIAANANNSASDNSNLYIEVIKPYVPGLNTDPVANHDTATVEQGESVMVNPLLNDSDLNGDTLTVEDISYNGTPISTNSGSPTSIIVGGNLAGTAYQDPSGNLVFESNPTFKGEVPFEYTINDGNGGNASSSINITVVEPTGRPEIFANDDANAAPQGEEMNGNVLENDQLNGTDPKVTSATVRFGGSDYPVVIGTPETILGIGTITVEPNGDYTFVPEADFEGTIIIEYNVCNIEGSCDTATLYLTSVRSCSITPNTDTPDGFTNVGISTLENKRTEWPNDVPNGFIALESKEKGFVITRTTSASIASPVEGMLIYDTTDNCFKLYNGTTWNCIAKSCN